MGNVIEFLVFLMSVSACAFFLERLLGFLSDDQYIATVLF
jgi:hypothetical protein